MNDNGGWGVGAGLCPHQSKPTPLVNGEYWPIVHPVAEPRLDVMVDS